MVYRSHVIQNKSLRHELLRRQNGWLQGIDFRCEISDAFSKLKFWSAQIRLNRLKSSGESCFSNDTEA